VCDRSAASARRDVRCQRWSATQPGSCSPPMPASRHAERLTPELRAKLRDDYIYNVEIVDGTARQPR
jgi:hypothetical protein